MTFITLPFATSFCILRIYTTEGHSRHVSSVQHAKSAFLCMRCCRYFSKRNLILINRIILYTTCDENEIGKNYSVVFPFSVMYVHYLLSLSTHVCVEKEFGYCVHGGETYLSHVALSPLSLLLLFDGLVHTATYTLHLTSSYDYHIMNRVTSCLKVSPFKHENLFH